MEDITNKQNPETETTPAETNPWDYYNTINNTTPTRPRPRTGNPRTTPKKHKRPKGVKHGFRKNNRKK